ncbi:MULTISPECIES: division/cell wall cluster transcriptional repressor MraZ [Flavobacterium]|uniref:Transcriptional regulator MraZ n=1 Tax=Flavobacterium keumense TaxID=1306518 RepID=A0ABY8N628_9FLAO|nr:MULTISPECIES: division/cell wall cluster transcriptional repressor MraZ [Flavobacterium]WGK94819.1 division/cell wall cluster transcriptional repressor MraZ [Flavobacterium keumense]
MNTIVGTYECKVDAKGRVLMPSPLKKQLISSLQEGFVLKRSVFQPCLELYPMQEWNVMMQKINKLNRFVKKNNDFIRRFTAGVKVVEIDALGRLLVPKDLIGFASITKDVVFSSAVTIVEIWDKDLYEKSINGEDVDFADLAEDVMGNVNEGDNGIS